MGREDRDPLTLEIQEYRQHERQVPDIEYILEQEKKRRTPPHVLKPDPQVLPRPQLGKAMMTYNLILKLDPLERLRMQQRRKPFFLLEDQDLRPGQAETRSH